MPILRQARTSWSQVILSRRETAFNFCRDLNRRDRCVRSASASDTDGWRYSARKRVAVAHDGDAHVDNYIARAVSFILASRRLDRKPGGVRRRYVPLQRACASRLAC